MSTHYLNNPDALSSLTVDPESPDRDAQLLTVAREIVEEWAEVEEARVEIVTGGITNLLFKLSAVDSPPLLFRIFGKNTEVVINRAAEDLLFADLSRRGFAPIFYGCFVGGRVEGFCEGYRSLKPHEMGQDDIRPLIAAKLREMHTIPPEAPHLLLWSTLRNWMDMALEATFEGADAHRVAALELSRYDALLDRLESTWHESWAPHSTAPGAAEATRAVLAHNDLLSGNVLYDATDGLKEPARVRFIDYEYSGCSYAGFDVANHFCEYAGFDSNFEKRFPPRAVRDAFIATYLGTKYSEEDVADFSRIVEFFVIPNHLFWGTWSVIQAKHSPIVFDYLEYARLRLKGCDLHRQELGILSD